MRAALISELAAPARIAERPDPTAGDGALVELRAAALNPVDVTVAAGRFPLGHPPLPYVPGVEAVGMVLSSGRFAEGTRVYACGGGLGIAADGTFADRFAAADSALIVVPDGIDDIRAVAFGTPGLAAWLPLTWVTSVRPGESVLVLGATGNVGAIAVQAARLLGAGRIVAVGRDEARLARASARGADAAVALGSDDLVERLREAFAGDSPTLVLDCLWGEPLEAALAVAGRGARIVHVGQSAGPNATLVSGFVRGKQLQILGYSNFAVPPDDLAAGYRALLARVEAGEIAMEVESTSLDQIEEAWSRQAAGPGAKIVVTL